MGRLWDLNPGYNKLSNISPFTCLTIHQSLSTTNLTVSACKTAIDLCPPPRLPLGIPAKIAISRALFYSSLQRPCDTKRSLQRWKAIDHFSLNLFCQSNLLVQVTWETFREKGKITSNRGGANTIYYATLVLYVFHADRKHSHGYITNTIWFFHCSKQSRSEVFAAGDAFHLTLNRLVSTQRTFNTNGLLSTKVRSSRTDI